MSAVLSESLAGLRGLLAGPLLLFSSLEAASSVFGKLLTGSLVLSAVVSAAASSADLRFLLAGPLLFSSVLSLGSGIVVSSSLSLTGLRELLANPLLFSSVSSLGCWTAVSSSSSESRTTFLPRRHVPPNSFGWPYMRTLLEGRGQAFSTFSSLRFFGKSARDCAGTGASVLTWSLLRGFLVERSCDR